MQSPLSKAPGHLQKPHLPSAVYNLIRRSYCHRPSQLSPPTGVFSSAVLRWSPTQWSRVRFPHLATAKAPVEGLGGELFARFSFLCFSLSFSFGFAIIIHFSFTQTLGCSANFVIKCLLFLALTKLLTQGMIPE